MRCGRRRAIRVIGAFGLLGGALARPGLASAAIRWRGVALGAEASITLHGADPTRARQLLHQCEAEVRRLEGIFSLHRPDSAISRLNREGRLIRPPIELLDLLAQARAVSRLTEGAFDLTVQPLWEVYAAHFGDPNGAPAGPPAAAVEAARALVDHRAIDADRDRVRLVRRGMAITANGIAQGYITDRIGGLLRAAGAGHVLVDLGEIRALGDRGDGTPWRVGLRRGGRDGEIAEVIDLDDRAVATSDPAGTRFSHDRRHHHLFDPGTGRPSCHARRVTVIAPTATRADALSTAFAVMAPGAVARARARLQDTEVHDDGAAHPAVTEQPSKAQFRASAPR